MTDPYADFQRPCYVISSNGTHVQTVADAERIARRIAHAR